MSRGSSGEMLKTVPPSSNVYTVLVAVAFVAAAAALTIIMVKAQALFGAGLFF